MVAKGDLDCEVYILRVSELHEREHEVDLLLIEENETKHYCLINNLSRLVSNQVSKHKEMTFICRRCLNPFNSEDRLAEHLESCRAHDAVKVVMPKEGSTLKFKHFFKSMRVPFIQGYLELRDMKGPNTTYIKWPTVL